MEYNNITNNHTLCFVGGKSGGHIIPCLTLAEQEKTTFKNVRILFFSTEAPLDQKIIHNHPDVTHHITLPLRTCRFKPLYYAPIALWRMTYAFFKSFFYLYKHKPNKVISTGGIVALPVCFAAWLLRIPIDLYELNAMPGKAIQLVAPLAQHVFVCFETARPFFKHSQKTAYPVRFKKQFTQHQIYDRLSFSSTKKTILILGGSQGSYAINQAIKKWLDIDKDVHKQLQIIHQTGGNDTIDWQQYYTQNAITAIVAPYSDDIEMWYHAADLVICRAGAGTLFETLFFKKLCITIPLGTKTTMHQYDNAQAMTKEYPDLFTMLEQDEILEYPLVLGNEIKKAKGVE